MFQNNDMTQKAIKELEALISNADTEYYNGHSVMEDSEYDALKHRLSLCDPRNSLLLTVGAAPKHNKVALPFYMGSMTKIKDNSAAIQRFSANFTGPYVVSDKLDGVSALYVMRKGIPKLYTRGNGNIGQDITNTLMKALHLPQMDRTDFAVRGELIVSKKDFQVLSQGKSIANARNMVSGIVNAKSPDKDLLKYVKFMAYAVYQPEMNSLEQFQFLDAHKFHTAPYFTLDSLSFVELAKILAQRKALSKVEIDGIIISSSQYIPTLTANPLNAFAFKSAVGQESAIVAVSNVQWNVSKDRLMKPILEFPAVSLSGVQIQKCTAFNADFVFSNCIGIGSKVKIIRAGDVIPHCAEVLSKSLDGVPLMPSSPYEWNSTHKDILDTSSNNQELEFKRFQHFIDKMSVEGVGKGVARKLFDSGCDDPRKFVSLDVEELLKVPSFQATSASNLFTSIQAAKQAATRDCMIYMIASNSFGRGFGERKLTGIVNALPYVKDPNSITVPTIADLLKIDGISNITATSFLDGLIKWRAFMKRFGLRCANSSVAVANGPQTFSGKRIVFTGVRNKELEATLVRAGATIQQQITKTTDLVIAKDANSMQSKLEKAREYDIRIVGIDAFLASM